MQSQYGVKISNYQASSIYDYDLGVRNNYNTTPAMLTNSLFLDFLKENGLKITNNGFTRDVICLQFDSGSDTYQSALRRINTAVERNRINRKKAHADGHEQQIIKTQRSKQTISERKRFIEEHADLFDHKSANELRIKYYTEGLTIKYKGRGDSVSTVKYKMLYRTPGKAKKGTVMFIREGLWRKAHNFLWMGLRLPKKNAPIVEIGAYSSLVTSTIEDKIKIEPENILILKDVDSFFKTNVISIETDGAKHCHAIERNNYELKNTLFDGQALIDESIFPPWGNGYVLLRHHFFKAAAFCAKIQKYFKDYFGDKYEIATVTDMWGNTHLAKNIKLITTDNGCKWCKFDVTYEYWCSKVWDNGAMFGIVKTAHKSKLGEYQRMSYQMINAMTMEGMDDILGKTTSFIYQLKTDDKIFLDYLDRTKNFFNDHIVLIELYKQNPEFINSEYFQSRRRQIIYDYCQDAKNGHVLQYGDNLVVVGNPYGMLMHAVGEDCLQDPTMEHEDGCIQCYTERFEDGEYLAFMRSPYNSQNNMLYLHNHYHEFMKEYFKLGEQIIAINMINTDTQDRGNGMDCDSDQGFTTNFPCIVEHAKNCYKNFPTIVNNIPKEKNIYDRTLENFAIVDNKLAAAQMDIGESSNMAQIGLSYGFNKFGEKYKNHVATLSVLAQCAIDNAKRSFDINIHSEIQRIKNEMDVKTNGYPLFFGGIRPDLRNKVNPKIKCPMNEAYKMRNKLVRYGKPTPNKEFFINHENQIGSRRSKRIEKMIEDFALQMYITTTVEDADWLLLRSDYEDLIAELRRLTISKNYLGLMSWLINRSLIITPGIKRTKDYNLQTKLNKNRSLLLKVLYDMNPKIFKKCFKTATEIQPM